MIQAIMLTFIKSVYCKNVSGLLCIVYYTNVTQCPALGKWAVHDVLNAN